MAYQYRYSTDGKLSYGDKAPFSTAEQVESEDVIRHCFAYCSDAARQQVEELIQSPRPGVKVFKFKDQTVTLKKEKVRGKLGGP